MVGSSTAVSSFIGVITRELYDALTNLQTEINEDPFGWLHEVNLNLALNISNE